jgi:hypothetical protein
MKKNQLAAIVVGAVLITGSTVSISAASISKGHHKSNSSKEVRNPGYLQGVAHSESWAALHSILSPKSKSEGAVPAILPPMGLVPSDSSTVTMPSDDQEINQTDTSTVSVKSEDDAIMEAELSDDAAPGVMGSLALPTPTSAPTNPAGIPNPMTKSHEGSDGHSDQSQGDSND